MDGNQLVDLLERIGFSVRSYSGRGMYGRQCVGVVVDSAGDAVEFGIALGCYAENGDLGQEVKRLSCATDSMGRDMIVYFPAVAWPVGRLDTDAGITGSEDDDNDE